MLYAMLQSATIQDGGNKKSHSRYTRLVAYNVSNLSEQPNLTGEFVVPLPQDANGDTIECSEIHFIANGVFLALSRDSNGHGDDDTLSTYKYALNSSCIF